MHIYTYTIGEIIDGFENDVINSVDSESILLEKILNSIKNTSYKIVLTSGLTNSDKIKVNLFNPVKNINNELI